MVKIGKVRNNMGRNPETPYNPNNSVKAIGKLIENLADEISNKNKVELIYVACPYTHFNEQIMFERFRAVNRFSAKLMGEGKYVFSPISHTHPIRLEGKLPPGWDFWEGYDRRMIACCNKLIVLCIDGWKESTGVQAEIKIAKEMGIPVEYVNLELVDVF